MIYTYLCEPSFICFLLFIVVLQHHVRLYCGTSLPLLAKTFFKRIVTKMLTYFSPGTEKMQLIESLNEYENECAFCDPMYMYIYVSTQTCHHNFEQCFITGSSFSQGVILSVALLLPFYQPNSSFSHYMCAMQALQSLTFLVVIQQYVVVGMFFPL